MDMIPMIPVLSFNIRIWVAEDDAELREILGTTLARDRREIRLFENGEGVLAALRGGDAFEILITDLVMPGADGLQVLSEVKSSRPESIVILMTGYASLDTAIQAIRGGAYDYIRKPFKLDELEVIVNNACEKVALVRENRHLLDRLREAMDELKSLRRLWEEYQTAMIGINLFPFAKKVSEMEVLLNQIPPDLELRREVSREKALDDLERLTELKKKRVIDQNEFLSFKKLLMRKLSEHP